MLANPRIRVKNREKAAIHIGDRVPVITTTAAATGGFVSESVSYLDVGLKLEVEPTIYLDDDVGIKIGLEVSNITREVQSSDGSTLTYQIGTRKASTVLRLRDGETQVLAGLISDEDRSSANRVPGLGDLPVLGRLFSSNNDNHSKTEIVLLITPHIMRTLAQPSAAALEFSAGTEASTGAAPFTPTSASPVSTSGPQRLLEPAPAPQGYPSAPAAPLEQGSAPSAPAQQQSVQPGGPAQLVPFGGVSPPKEGE